MKLLFLAILIFIPLQVSSFEVVVFEKRIKLAETCTLLTSHEKSIISGSQLICNLENITSFELSIGGNCNYQQFINAIDEPTEKIEIDVMEKGVRYIEFHLKDRKKGTPVFSRVITDKNSCLIALGDSLEAVSDKTEPLWLVGKK